MRVFHFAIAASVMLSAGGEAYAANWLPLFPGDPQNWQWIDTEKIEEGQVTIYNGRGPETRILRMYKLVASKKSGVDPSQSGVRWKSDQGGPDFAYDCQTGDGYSLSQGVWIAHANNPHPDNPEYPLVCR